ncbi:MAG: 2-phospho-L-lactate guanylyltransferase [Gordonia sp. (in: high G+C Gram-positive bacteria)]|uniref:2-phospho-L-lactate guanylyltransferase n=1 Tax=Gordonia sp. (in: high G+C Gram-positive bacteria) TaxID=84139 RepID=UPI003C707A4F
MSMTSADSWSVIVPMKDLTRAKSRMGEAFGDRRELALAMARDTLEAIASARRVAQVLVVCDAPGDVARFARGPVGAIARPGLGLNEAIAAGAEHLRAGSARDLAVLPGDLPGLRAADLDRALLLALTYRSGVVPDRLGVGTTLLTARRDTDLVPRFGEGSFRRHLAAGAVELMLPAESGLRSDFDRPSDAHEFAGMLGRRTRKVLRRERPSALAG